MAVSTGNGTYLYGGDEIDMKDFIKAIKLSAPEFMRRSGFDADQSQAFMGSLDSYIRALEEGRLSGDVAGSIYDSAGALGNDPVNYTLRRGKGKIVGQDEYNSMRAGRRQRAVRGFEPNRQVATYLDTVARALTSKEEEPEEEAEKFDWSKGLWNSFMRKLNPNGSPNLGAWLNKDPFDEVSGKRGYGARARAFGDYIAEYINKLPEKMDFSGVGTGWTRDEYVDMLHALQNKLASGQIDEDFYLMLDQLGSDANTYMPFWTDKKAYGEEEESEDDEKTAKMKKAVQERMDQQYNAFMSGPANMYIAQRQLEIPIWNKAKTDEQRINSYLENLNNMNKSGQTKLKLDSRSLSQATGKEWAPYMAQYFELFPDQFVEVGGNGKYAGGYYLPSSFNTSNGTLLYYQPDTGKVGRVFAGRLDAATYNNYWETIMESLMQELDENGRPAWQKNGGSIILQDGGEVTDDELEAMLQQYYSTHPEVYEQAVSGTGARATENEAEQMVQTYLSPYSKASRGGTSFNDFKGTSDSLEARRMGFSRETGPSGGKRLASDIGGPTSDYSYSTQLRGVDYARIGAMAADIAGMIDPEGISSACLFYGSDVTSLLADLSDEDVSAGKAFTNFGLNAILSTIGFLPVIGGGAKSGSLVAKAAKLAKPMLYAGLAMGAFDLLSNGPDVMNSLQKLLGRSDGSVESKMTLNDWRNIYVLASTLIGGTNVYKGARAKSVAKKVGGTNDVLVAAEKDGKTSFLHLTGEDAAAMKAARDKGGSEGAKEAQEIVKKFGGVEDSGYKLPTESVSERKFFKHTFREGYEGVNWKEAVADYMDPAKMRSAAKNYSGLTRRVLKDPKKYAGYTGVFTGKVIHPGAERISNETTGTRGTGTGAGEHVTGTEEKIKPTAPTTKKTVPTTEETAPKTKKTAPKTEETPPTTEETAPKTKKTAPKTEETPPKTEETAPTTKKTPVDKAAADKAAADKAAEKAKKEAELKAEREKKKAEREEKKKARKEQFDKDVKEVREKVKAYGRKVGKGVLEGVKTVGAGVKKGVGAAAEGVKKGVGTVAEHAIKNSSRKGAVTAGNKFRLSVKHARKRAGIAAGDIKDRAKIKLTNPDILHSKEYYKAREKFGRVKQVFGLDGFDELREHARLGYSHSNAYDKIKSELGVSDRVMYNLGLYGKGGSIGSTSQRDIIRQTRLLAIALKNGGNLKKKIVKGDDGLSSSATLDLSGIPDDVLARLGITPQLLAQLGITTSPASGYSYGAGFTPHNADWYSGGEFGTDTPVSLSGIQNAVPQGASHGVKDMGFTVDYNNGQANMDAALGLYMADPNNFIGDTKAWVTQWLANPANKGRTQADMIGDYNNLVQSLYNYKRGVVSNGLTGDNAYFNHKDTQAFNQTHKALYGSANSENGIFGYDPSREGWNGTTTSSRFVFRPGENGLTNINWGINTGEGATQADLLLAQMLSNVEVDPNGMLRIKNQGAHDDTVTEAEQTEGAEDDGNGSNTDIIPGNLSQTDMMGNENEPQNGAKPDWNSIMSQAAPDFLRLGNLYRTLNLNDRLKKMLPSPLLQTPFQRHLQVMGDYGAMMRGNAQNAQANSFAARMQGADMNANNAMRLNAALQGVGYSEVGAETNDKAKLDSAQRADEQEEKNLAERVSSARTNQDRINTYNTTKATNNAAFERAKTESINNFVNGIISRTDAANEEKKTIRDSFAQQSMSNEILNNLDGYNITDDADVKDMFTKLKAGTLRLSDYSKEQQQKFSEAYNRYNQALNKALAQYYGVSYLPYNIPTQGADANSPTSTQYILDILAGNKKKKTEEKHGGRLYASGGSASPETDVRVEIQKMRTRVSNMQSRQKHQEMRMNAFEKELDRMERSAAKYINSMKNKK